MSATPSKFKIFPAIIRTILFVFGVITIPFNGQIILNCFEGIFTGEANEIDQITFSISIASVFFMISALPLYFALSDWSKVKRLTQFLKKIPKFGNFFATIQKFIVFKGTNFGLGIVLGFLIWALCEIITGNEEAVDAGNYLLLALMITGMISSVPSPKYFFSGALGIFVGQVAFMAFVPAKGFGANFWPLTAIGLVPAMLISMFGGIIVYIVSRILSPTKKQI
jgi:hypothetical protein